VNFKQFNIDTRLQAGIKRAGFITPTPIQAKAIPVALAGKDIIGTAQTGTGKTAAFVLPILNKLISGPRSQTRALIVAPTRELAEQINHSIKVLSQGTNLRSATIYGGVGDNSQIKALRSGVEIIVACPGRFLSLIYQEKIKLNKVEILVIDEADQMFDMGFLPDIYRIIKLTPRERQTMLFSATFPKEVEKLVKDELKDPIRIAIGVSCPAKTVSQELYPVSQQKKRELLLELLKDFGNDSVLIFTRTKHRASRLQRQLMNDGYRVTSLHGDRSQGQRDQAIMGFKRGKYKVMVATDIASRGLDIERVSHVINFDMPNTTDAYIHRIGRTGRAKRTGDAYTLVTPEDESMIRSLEKIIGYKLSRTRIDGFDYKTPSTMNSSATSTNEKRNDVKKQSKQRKNTFRSSKSNHTMTHHKKRSHSPAV